MMARPADDRDARAFSPAAAGLEALIEAEDRGDIAPPTYHFAPTGKTSPACGAVGFVRDHSFSVTCPECKVVAETREAKARARRERRAASRRGR